MIRRTYRYLLAQYARVAYRGRHRRLVMEQVGNKAFVVLPDVFNPVLFRSSVFLVEQFTAQLQPGGEIQTLNVFAERLGRAPADLRAFLDSAEEMEKHLWCNIPPEALREVEAQGYALARQQLIRYLSDSKPA